MHTTVHICATSARLTSDILHTSSTCRRTVWPSTVTSSGRIGARDQPADWPAGCQSTNKYTNTRIYIYIYIYLYIQTRHNVRLPALPILFQFILSHCAGGAHCLARGLIRARLVRLVRLVLDPWRYQVAKCACSAGPDLGSLSSHRCSCLLLPPLILYVSICLTQSMRWVPCAPWPCRYATHFNSETVRLSLWVFCSHQACR